MNYGNLPFIADEQESESRKEIFRQIKRQKLKIDLKLLCTTPWHRNSNDSMASEGPSRAACLLEFAAEVFQLKFDDEPDYDRLRSILESVVLQNGGQVDFKYDWEEATQTESKLNDTTHDIYDRNRSKNLNISKSFAGEQSKLDTLEVNGPSPGNNLMVRMMSMSETNQQLQQALSQKQENINKIKENIKQNQQRLQA
mmetsp:Transcript_3306/g.5491  ORF Transcript_3306/g.5491 Transcript_3306/m.5491 type:complete len:198 (+) Transcript_3306:786-1379(+)